MDLRETERGIRKSAHRKTNSEEPKRENRGSMDPTATEREREREADQRVCAYTCV